jgi:YHS domain-containing protein
MKAMSFILITTLIFFSLSIVGNAKTVDEKEKKISPVEANVWTGEDGNKYYKCPVMGGEGVVDSTTTFSIVDGKRYYYCCAGCAEKFQANPSKYLKKFAKPGNVIKIDKDGKYFRCPVSGKKDLVSEKTAYSDYKGKRYYFCCNDCKTKFNEGQEKYLKPGKKQGCLKKDCSKKGCSM